MVEFSVRIVTAKLLDPFVLESWEPITQPTSHSPQYYKVINRVLVKFHTQFQKLYWNIDNDKILLEYR